MGVKVMANYSINQYLKLKKIDLSDEKDLDLVRSLTDDPLVSGNGEISGYLWDLEKDVSSLCHLKHDRLVDSSFAIYHGDKPIGFLEISDVFKDCIESHVDLVYALVKEARGYGYMHKTLSVISNRLLNDDCYDIDYCECFIDSNNQASMAVAEKSGFSRDQSLEFGFCSALFCYTKRRR